MYYREQRRGVLVPGSFKRTRGDISVISMVQTIAGRPFQENITVPAFLRPSLGLSNIPQKSVDLGPNLFSYLGTFHGLF